MDIHDSAICLIDRPPAAVGDDVPTDAAELPVVVDSPSDIPVNNSPAIPRPSTNSIAGGIASVVFHLWLLAMLASLTIDNSQPPAYAPIESRFVREEPVPEPEAEVDVKYELANPNDRELEVREAINGRSVGVEKTLIVRPQSAPLPLLDSRDPEPAESLYDIPQGMELDDRIVIKGTTGESTVQIETALDRVTWEIANHLLEHKVLVVWMLDASASLKDQRAAISNRLRRIYGELGALEETGQVITRSDQALLSGVVTYGEKTTFVTPEPTDRFDVIQDAVKNAPTDPSGVENVFGAVDQTVRRWSKYRTGQSRSMMLVIVTDETGDDFPQLEMAINSCKRYGAKAYVIGPAAVFGRRQGFVPYVAPEDHKTYQLPVDLGPESFVLEVVSLPFWFGGPQYDFLSAGMGPYGLTRLIRETGGVYFMTNMTTSVGFSPLGVFDPQILKAFEPDYSFGTPQSYIDDVNRHPLRRAVMRAGELSQKYKAKGTPELELKVNPNNYLARLTDIQKSAAETTYMLDGMLSAFEGNLEPEYQKEKSPRWRANYNLTLGRLLALKVRAVEYNSACAQLKQLGIGDIANKSNHWIFRPGRQINSGAGTRKMALEAEKLLRRVVDEAPGTPWALLAQRDLSIPFGFEVIQKYDPPPNPREQASAPPAKPGIRLANDPPKKKATPPAKPAPPPKLPKL